MMAGPGAGKGTLSQMLMADGDYKYIGIGEILRANVTDTQISKIISSGNLVPDELVYDLVNQEISNGRDYILDGFPRNLNQAKWFVENYSEKYDIRVIYMFVPKELMLARINKRLNSGAGRADDADGEVISRRLDAFYKTTMPAIDWLRNEKSISFNEINACGDANSIYSDIISVLVK